MKNGVPTVTVAEPIESHSLAATKMHELIQYDLELEDLSKTYKGKESFNSQHCCAIATYI